MRNLLKVLLIKMIRYEHKKMGVESILICQDRITKKVRVYNVSNEAIRGFKVNRKEVSFRASFDGVVYEMSEPLDNVVEITYIGKNGLNSVKFFEISEESGPELKVVSGLKRD